MNERIQALVKQAGDYVNKVYTPPVRSKTPGKIWEDGHIDWHTHFNKKFAELIVQECAAVAHDYVMAENNKLVEKVHISPWQLQDKIKEHFGVEE